jgi:tRNA1(Val) A37 N6-methylase TrmN6
MNQAQTGMQARDAHQQRMKLFMLAAISSGTYDSMKGHRVPDFGAGHGRLPLIYPDMASYIGVDYFANLLALGNQGLANAGRAKRASLLCSDLMSCDGAKSAFDVGCSLGMLA